MSGPIKRERGERPETIKEQRARELPFELIDSPCWDKWQSPGIVRFLMSDAALPYWVGVPFGSITSSECIEKEDGSFSMGVQWKDNDQVREIFIRGPKVPDLFAQFCIHIIAAVRADGKDITRVTLLPPQEAVSL